MNQFEPIPSRRVTVVPALKTYLVNDPKGG